MSDVQTRRALMTKIAGVGVAVWAAPAVTTIGAAAFATGSPEPGPHVVSVSYDLGDGGGSENIGVELKAVVEWGGATVGLVIWSSTLGGFSDDDFSEDRAEALLLITRTAQANPVVVTAYLRYFDADEVGHDSPPKSVSFDIHCEPYLPPTC